MATKGMVNIGGRMVPAWLLDISAEQLDSLISITPHLDAIEDILKRYSNDNLLNNAYWANPDAIVDQRKGYIVPAGTPYYQFGIDNPPVAGTLTAPIKVDSFYSNGAPLFTINGVQYYSAIGTTVRGYCQVGYTIDRWKLNGGALTIGTQGLSLTAGMVMFQIIDRMDILSAGSLTVSYLDGNGKCYWGPLTPGYSSYGNFYFCHNGQNILYIMSKSSDDVMRAVKLELGTHQTLAHESAGGWILNDPAPDFGDELRRCREYYIPPANVWCMASWPNGGGLRLEIPCQMRATPTVIGDGFRVFWGNWRDITPNGTSLRPTECTVGFTHDLSSDHVGKTFLINKTPGLSCEL